MPKKRSPSQHEKEVGEGFWIELDPAVSFARRVRRSFKKGKCHLKINAAKSKLTRKVRRKIVFYNPASFGLPEKTPISAYSEEARRRMGENGDRPCDIDDGVAIGQSKGFFPKSFYFLDEDAVCIVEGRRRCVPFIIEQNDGRHFHLHDEKDALASSYSVFPAVREEEYLDA